MRKFLFAALLLSLASCRNDIQEYGDSFIYPDYVGVTVPSNIAPLNFDYNIPSEGTETIFTAGDVRVSFKGRNIRWNRKKWLELTSGALKNGGEISVYSSAADSTWKIFVSADEMDYGLTYRKLEPGYEVYSRMGIYERDLSSYDETALIENTDFSGCVNCHSTDRGSSDRFSLHIRGDHGATLLQTDGRMEAFDTKTDSTLGLCVYPYWHPDGKYIAYSTNATRQLFHVQPDKLIEVFDMASDLQVYDIAANRLISAPQVKTAGYWETFPVFSPDGGTIYYCRAAAKPVPDSLSQVRYNLCSVSFNADKGTIGDDVRTLIDADSVGKSISFPRPSYDGKYIMYTLSDYGQFSIWHHEADLWLYDTAAGESRKLDAVNSTDTESFHNWSTNSRWFVFSSRRDDGQFTRLYLAHIDENGNVGKPFLLPQKDPTKYYGSLFMSYNVPEFVTGKVDFNYRYARRLINSDERIKMKYK